MIGCLEGRQHHPYPPSNMAEISPTNGHLNGTIFDYQRLLGMETGDIYETISRGSNASQPPSRRGGKTTPNPSMPLSNRRVAKVGSMFVTWILCVGLPSNTPMTHAGYLLNGFQWLMSVQLEKTHHGNIWAGCRPRNNMDHRIISVLGRKKLLRN